MHPSSRHDSPVEFLRLRAQALCADILAGLPAGLVRAVFLGGSVARGEVWAARVEGDWEIYSDLDVYVVVSDARALRPVRAQALAANERLGTTGGGARFLRGAEVGVYTIEDLVAQPARPGTAGLNREAFWLFGDRALLDAIATWEPRGIAPGEALYLLENRIAELSGLEASDPPRQRLARVLALKTRLDVGAAHLIAAGSYVTSARGRAEAIRTYPPATMNARVRAELEAAFSDRDRFDAYLAASGPAEVSRAVTLAADAWRTLAERVLGVPGGTAAALVNRRCGRGRRWSNYREFVRLRHAGGGSRGRGAVRGIRLAAFSPRAALRTHALVAALRSAEPASGPGLAAIERYVERVTAALGFSDGTRARRAAAAYRAIS